MRVSEWKQIQWDYIPTHDDYSGDFVLFHCNNCDEEFYLDEDNNSCLFCESENIEEI